MELETAGFALPGYALSLGGAAPQFFCSLDVGDFLRVLCAVSVEAVGGSCGELRVTVGVDGPLAKQAFRLQRVLEAAVLLERYPKTRFVISLHALHCTATHDVLHHLLNAATLALLHAQVELRVVPVGSSCFLGARGEPLAEGSTAGTGQAVLVQAFGPAREIMLLSFDGGLATPSQAIALLSAAVAKVGRELLGQLKRAALPESSADGNVPA